MSPAHASASSSYHRHRFLDEAGDTAFFGEGRVPIVGQRGVSLSFGIGMLRVDVPLEETRTRIRDLAQQVETDEYLKRIPSVSKKAARGGFYFHATDDPPEVRERFFRLLRSLDCSLEMVVARKDSRRFLLKHGGKEAEFYADVLSHLIKNKLKMGEKLVLNIAERGSSTKNTNLERALAKAVDRFLKRRGNEEISSEVVFNVQRPTLEPLLCVADYLCWSVQRVFERGDLRFYEFIRDKISLVVDLYDTGNYEGSRNYYRRNHPLTAANKLGPPSP